MMEDSRQETILLLSKVLAKFQWLLNSYNLDYFVEEHWNLLPRTWQICLQNFDKNDIPLLLCPSKNNTTKHVFPLSLLCLREISILVRSSRTMAIDSNLSTQLAANEVNSDLTLSFSNEHKLPVKPLKTSDHILCRKIKLKKRHEIERLCKVIPPLLKMVDNCTDIIDCGSGQGHLDRVLTLCYGYRVFSIEADDDNVNSANDIDSTILNALRKSRLTKMADNDMPTKLNCFLTNEDKIGQLVGSQVLQDKHLLLGLHACGPLSNIILEQFVNSPDASCLVLACCCYMKTGNERFPMSNFLQKNIDFVLTREAKEVACHAIEKFLNKFYTKELDSLKVHGFRSCLELLINKYDPSKTHKGMRSVKIDSKMTFKEYLLKATRGLDVSIPCDVLESEFMVSYLSRLDQVVIFYALRLLVAPLVELFILMDYQEYLSEHSAVKRTYLVPLFEPSISPRNLILIAHK